MTDYAFMPPTSGHGLSVLSSACSPMELASRGSGGFCAELHGDRGDRRARLEGPSARAGERQAEGQHTDQDRRDCPQDDLAIAVYVLHLLPGALSLMPK